MANIRTMQRLAKERAFTEADFASLVKYDPVTGVLTRPNGKHLGSVSKAGYLKLSFGGPKNRIVVMAHRVAWLLTYGEWPSAFIDHIDRNRLNNRLANLRVATDSQNQHNRSSACHSRTGVKGVTWDKSRQLWMARLNHQGSFVNLGRFKTCEEAQAAYAAAASRLHGEFFRPSVDYKPQASLNPIG